MVKTGLVLEGGGMRGVYTCGVLEYFLEKEFHFNYIVGVSAGACNAVSYISRQKGRNAKVNIDFVRDNRYMSLRNMIREKSYFSMNFIFDEIPNKLVPFDYNAFENAACEFKVGVTDCRTGKAYYLNKDEVAEGFIGLRATASLPMMSPIIKYKGLEFLDGGIADPIPIHKALEDGNEKGIVVLTRNKGYRKSPMRFINLVKLKYRRYPQLIEAMLNRHKIYNDTLDYIENLENQGKIIVIRPSNKLKVGRLERDPEKLRELFADGYRDAEREFDRIREFISD